MRKYLYSRKSLPRRITEGFENNSEVEEDAKSEVDQTNVPEELESDEHESEGEDEGGPDNGEESRTDIDSILINVPKFDKNSEDEISEGSESSEDDTDDGEQLNQLEHYRLVIRQLIKRVRACVNNIRDTRAVIDYVKRKAKANDSLIKCTLIMDFEIRWNTTCIMLNRFLKNRFIIDHINSQPYKIPHTSTTQQIRIGSKQFEFTNEDRNKLEGLHKALRSFFVTTSILSGKNYPSLTKGEQTDFMILLILLISLISNDFK